MTPGYFGERILGTDFACDIVAYRGAGSYVCGEASGLLSSLEGKRGYPRNRPPRLTVQGLYKRPTVVNNVETLANVAGIVANGAAWYKSFGTAKSPGTQLVSISGHIARPGVYEVEYGYPLAKFLYEDCGGMVDGRKLKALIPGGISTKVLTGAEVDNVTFDHQSLNAAGSSVGSGGMVAIADGTCMVRLLQVMLRFYHHESCGQCTPCREGTGWMHRIIDRIVSGDGRLDDLDRLIGISRWNDGNTICGMGDAAGYATIGILAKFRDEFEYFIENKRSRIRRKSRMPQIFINGQPVEAERNQTVMEAARANGFFIPYFCWHPKLSVAGNCRICAIQIEDRSWVEIACNMPVSEGLRVLTDSDEGQGIPQGHHAAADAESSGRLRHLRQVRRMHAAGLSTTVQRRAVDFARCQGARRPSSTRYPSGSARQRALHPLLALRALYAGDLEVERAGDHAARRCVAGPRRRKTTRSTPIRIPTM